MNDTHPDIAIRFKKQMMSRSGQQRLLMGCSMYDAAKSIVRSAILAQSPEITPEELRREVFLRFYGQEFSQADREKIISAITCRVSHSGPRRV